MSDLEDQKLKTRVKNPDYDGNSKRRVASPGMSDKTQIKGNAQSNVSANRIGNTVQKTRIKNPQNNTRPRVNTPNAAQIRTLKGRFILEKVLGVGGMGVVYKAKDRLKVEARDRDPYVAIKVLSDEFKTHPEAFIALQRESRKAQRIAHPNTVKVYDFDRDGDIVFMTMEYMVGRPLDQMIKQYHSTGLPRDDAWNILYGMCSALIHAHNENIVHSDFKPGNVFITEGGMAKIFDFGIARAVAIVDRTAGKSLDRTVFDAGTLGALTPAYASLEMLLGKTPDVRDDIYALGCIAYELLTGEHPFNKLPADEAYNKNLKPKRITDISKRRWRAIEKALAFKREDRIESVEEFHHQLTTKNKPRFILVASLLAAIGVSAFVYNQLFDRAPISASQSDMRDELKFEIRYNLYKEKIERLLLVPTFSSEWEESAWEEIRGVYELFNGEPDDWVLSARARLYKLYVNEIRGWMKKTDFARAGLLLNNAYRYTDDTRLLDNEQIKLTEEIRKQNETNKRLATDKLRVIKSEGSKRSKTNLFNLAIKNVNQQLECRSRLNMRDFKIAITKLRSLNFARYRKIEGKIVKTLSQCITLIGKTYPERALDDKKYALRIFSNNPLIMGINIRARDACDISIAGLGARGDRAICRDKLNGGGAGPAMVVIPGNNVISSMAIGKYEISNKEFASYCKVTGDCIARKGKESLPATNITIQSAKSYLKWLSKKTRQKYRLPTRKEWLYAVKSRSAELDPNRNCQLSTRGIHKGGELVRINTGKQNSWGLVNHVGNAQEWVYAKGRKLIAVGGSYRASMEKCTIKTALAHQGKADNQTGFRVVRELTR